MLPEYFSAFTHLKYAAPCQLSKPQCARSSINIYTCLYAYRIGQTKDVTVYYPTVVDQQFKTFEETLDELLSKKRALAGDMLNGTADISAAEFKEILEAPCS